MLRTDQQRGFSIIELLISLVVGMLVLAGILQVFNATFRSSSEAVSNANLNEQLRAVTNALGRDVRRSGYWAGAINDLGTGLVNNPFTGLSVVDQDADGTGDCVLYGYDADNSGETAAASHAATEWRGFRHNANTGAIEVTTAGGTQALVNAGTCDNTWTWTDFVDPKVLEITNFDLTLVANNLGAPIEVDDTNCPTTQDEFWVEVRTLIMDVDGRLAGNAEATRSTSTIVKVRNDRLFIQTVACPAP